MEVPGVVNLIAASCIVHNMCELQKNEVLEEWMVGTAAIPQPDQFPNVLEERDDATDIFAQHLRPFLCLKLEIILELVHNRQVNSATQLQRTCLVLINWLIISVDYSCQSSETE